MKGASLAALLVLGLAPVAHAQSAAERLNDYPTETRADYVFACMAANGQTRETLQKCACSIDRIASILPYEKYVEAETVLSLQLVGGDQMSMFKSAQMSANFVADLRRAQAEADMICF